MLRFLGLRLIHTLPVIIGITLAAFVLIHAVPGDPIRIMLGGKASQEHVDEVEHQLGIDRPLPEQYVDFVAGIPQGDLGESIILRRPVSLRFRSASPRRCGGTASPTTSFVCLPSSRLPCRPSGSGSSSSATSR
jgi:ABC-type dipeptide/oligopeptide/nickel transport system permease component